MSINYDHLMAYEVPEISQSYGPSEIARYALSIGVGHDPLDARQLPYAGGPGGPRALPAIVNVLGHPGFWLGNPDTGINALQLVHGEQGMSIHRPIPAQASIVAKTRVTDLIDKGEGRGALLFTEKVITESGSGALLATCRSTIFLRGDGGFGGPRRVGTPPHQVPDTSPDAIFETATRPEQALLYRWNGDSNPLHLDPQVAAKAGFERPILQGLCSFGCAAHALLATLCDYEADRFGSMDARFTAHVFPGETLRTEIWNDGSFQTRALERDVIVIGNGLFKQANPPGITEATIETTQDEEEKCS